MKAPRTIGRDARASALIDAVSWLFDHGHLGRGAAAAIVGIITEHDSLWLVGAVGDLPPVPIDRPLTLPLQADLPLCTTARLGTADCLATADEIRRRSPWLTAFAPTAHAAVTVPLWRAGRPFGVLGVTYDGPAIGRRSQLITHLGEIGDHLGTILTLPI